MGRIVVMNHLTLDGVMQGPGRPEEDTRGGLVLGRGRRMFPDGEELPLRLMDSVVTPAGVLVATYEPALDKA